MPTLLRQNALRFPSPPLASGPVSAADGDGPLFMDHAQWLEQTAVWGSRRSEAMRELDEALRNAEQVDLSTVTHDGDTLQMTVNPLFLKLNRTTEDDLRKAWRREAVARVRAAFGRWAQTQSRKGQRWQDSSRNGRGAITQLHDRLVALAPRMSDSEHEGIAAMEAARDAAIPQLFLGCKVVSRSHADVATSINRIRDLNLARRTAQNTYTAGRKIQTLASAAPSHGGGGATVATALGSAAAATLGPLYEQVKRIVAEAFGVPDAGLLIWDEGEDLLREALQAAIEGIKDELKAIVPVIGLVAASATLAQQGVKLVQSVKSERELLDVQRRLVASDSKAALAEIHAWQLRDIALRGAKTARAATNVGTQAAAIASHGVGAAAQTAISLSLALVALMEIVGDLALQYRQKRALSELLNQRTAEPLGRHVFTQSPLAAAYFLLNTPASFIALQLVDFGSPAWREEVALLCREGKLKDGGLRKVLTEAERVIQSSRYRILRTDGGRFRERCDAETWTRWAQIFG
jgi:hypothetical protein